MEELVVKQGALYLQLQQTFGKKWKRFWAVLYRGSPRCAARLELQEGAEWARRAEAGRRLVRLCDCVHVAEAGADAAGPGDTVPFLLETTERRFLLAAHAAEAAEWIRRLCELAFPRSREEPGAAPEGAEGEFSMEENSLYSWRGRAGPEQAFEVTVRVTPPSQRCRLRGRCVLRAGEAALELWHAQGRELLASWPYRFLRRFGRDKATFSFEAGRRCASGEGNFEFDTRQGNEIFQAIEAAIEVQRGRPRQAGTTDHEEPVCPSGEVKAPKGDGKGAKGRLGMPTGAGEASAPFQPSQGTDCPYAEPLDDAAERRGPDSAGLEAEYAVPFDTVAKSFLARQFGAQEGLPAPPSTPRDGGRAPQPPGRPPAPKAEHIYDEPEALSGLSLYDEPREVAGEAWRRQAAPEEPPGPGCPYDPQRDDYAVPAPPCPLRDREWLGRCDYDNVALRAAAKRNLQ
uniref:Docking protein 2 n=1 Tax=Taeniopygia guttata TaxID=59729 RepID=A0A674GNV4_TAEGU|nr:docking protein 2 [Taeniopygia guttata]